ncbi:hypothetical protein EDD36DRAFT_488506 [Exophiala viscosa]|uniref:Uncharacterized protein n=1 Tax=Exophiala viscosa TaxID=2486360 RepID=A0AAN6DVD9_9EURO|nr:hypothetical protein EDD36DRAFT_488506 [Exophiala viscosa]
MDTELRGPNDRDHVKSRFSAPPGNVALSRVTSAPEQRRPDESPLSPRGHASRKRDSPMHRPYQRPVTESSSPSTTSAWPLESYASRRFMDEPPDKRPRLDYVPEKEEIEADSSMTRLDHYATSRYVYPPESLPPPPPPPPPSQSNSENLPRFHPESCGNCSDTESIVAELVRGLLDLQSDVTQILRLPPGRKAAVEILLKHEVTKLGLKQSLAWSITEIRSTSRLIRENPATRGGLPPLSNVVPPTPTSARDVRRLSLHNQSSAAPPSINDLRRVPLHLDPPRNEEYARRPYEQSDQMPRPFEQTLPPIQQSEEFRRNEQPVSSVVGQSPYPSSSSSVFGSAQSPIQSQPSSRTLPSPPGMQYPRAGSSGSVHYSPSATHSAQHSHLQDLQHQISTKTLALQTLQREHDQLLAAFSRSQIRCTALDKKSQVSDHEINSLTEDKIRLQQQVETLEAQVQDLMRSRDELTQKSTVDGAQWRQIMAMSSQLQMQGAEEARRFKAKQDEWEQERTALRKRIEELESGEVAIAAAKTTPGPTSPVASDAILTSDSVEVLRQEIIKLRRRCFELEAKLQGLAGEAAQIDSAINAMESVRRTLAGKKRSSDDS